MSVKAQKADKISELTTSRLSVYLRCVNELVAEGQKSVSSEGLAERFHLNSAQIRKDLAYFGEFGVRGVGYYIESLRDHLTKILGLDQEHRVGIFGAGRLGTALADYYYYTQTNFQVAALFDTDKNKIGKSVGEAKISVYDLNTLPQMVKKEKIDVAVIAVPATFAQPVLEAVAQAGIKAVLNFAPTPLKAPSGVKLKTVDLTISLEGLSFFLAKPSASEQRNHKPKAIRREK
jgi:redox-sensing transcriptional repressor